MKFLDWSRFLKVNKYRTWSHFSREFNFFYRSTKALAAALLQLVWIITWIITLLPWVKTTDGSETITIFKLSSCWWRAERVFFFVCVCVSELRHSVTGLYSVSCEQYVEKTAFWMQPHNCKHQKVMSLSPGIAELSLVSFNKGGKHGRVLAHVLWFDSDSQTNDLIHSHVIQIQ